MLKANSKKVLAISLWASFTLALLSWWIIFAFRQLSQLKGLGLALDDKILRHQKMIIYEGLTLFLCLGIGAFFLLYFVYSENKRLKERRDFLSAFTHDLKTSISVLRLKLEKIREKSPEVEEVQSIGTRLSIQLQNALQASYFESQELLLEEISILKEMDYIRGLWPDLSISFKGNCKILTDRMALRSIINNIIQNAIEHAQAKTVFIEQIQKDQKIEVVFSSDGDTVEASLSEIESGEFKRRSEEGSGLGLKISKNLMRKMGGKLFFSTDENKRLRVHTEFKKAGECL